jgi:hypothetical protein
MLKDALAGLPTRPVLYLSLTVLVLGLAYHFTTTYQSCRGHADLRQALRVAIETSARGTDPLRLSAITDFAWDRADILVNYKPSGESTDCPFQWDWSRETREQLITGDLLTVIVFLRDGKLVNYLDYRRDWAEFGEVKNPYTPKTAVFAVSRSPASYYEYILLPASGKN